MCSPGPVKETHRSVMGSSLDVSMLFPPRSCTKSPVSAQPGIDLCGSRQSKRSQGSSAIVDIDTKVSWNLDKGSSLLIPRETTPLLIFYQIVCCILSERDKGQYPGE